MVILEQVYTIMLVVFIRWLSQEIIDVI